MGNIFRRKGITERDVVDAAKAGNRDKLMSLLSTLQRNPSRWKGDSKWVNFQTTAVNCHVGMGWTPFICAAMNGDLETMNYLYSLNADVSAACGENETALHFAAKEGYISAMQFLLDHGAHPDAKNNDAWTPLHHAVWNGHASLISCLVEHKADINAPDSLGWMPLHRALDRGKDGCVKELIRLKADIHGATYTANWKPLHVAASTRRVSQSMVHLLLKSGAEIDERTRDGDTPARIAAKNERFDALTWLICRGADCESAKGAVVSPRSLTVIENTRRDYEVSLRETLLEVQPDCPQEVISQIIQFS